MANAFLAMKISFVNQVSQFCETIGADVLEVMKGLSMDPRIGDKFLTPGPGWGGSCFPKDTRALIEMSKSVGSPMTLINETVVSNESHIQNIVELTRTRVQLLDTSKPKIGVLGLSFKANTDDTRSSPALEIIKRLQPYFLNIVAYDPVAKMPNDFVLDRVDTIQQAVSEADVVLLLTEWDEFSALDPQVLKNLMRNNVVIDTRYILDRVKYAKHGLRVIQYGVPELSLDHF
jgi:UDPglucose 6-dehydrogenase